MEEKKVKRKQRRCEICDESRVRDYHHIVPKSMDGSDESWNRVNLCPNHHRLVHRGLIVINGWDDIGYKYKLNWYRVDSSEAKPLILKKTHHGSRQKKQVTRD